PISGTIIWGTDISGAFFSGDWNSFAYGMGGATVLGLEVYAGAEVANKAIRTAPKGRTAPTSKTPVIGRISDLEIVGINEYRVADLLPNQGSIKANWIQNSGALRTIMKEGNPIRDVSLFDSALDPRLGIAGTKNANTFLHMERNLLYDHGWIYSNGYWYPY
ncbi:MAG: hypothetical protein FWH08_07260, partial [Oscillospiraceae bacterium]|nr:hypothetical protein [Oscillospiraceae bacterium]